tara:strand:+ start:156 stop:1088 length:933 start_codon:yes stop_codon:yes gene_type:complete
MKKLIFFLILIIFQTNISFSKDYFTGEKISELLDVNKRLKIPLSDGEWEVLEYVQMNWGSLTQRGLTIVKIENNNVNEMISIYEGFMGVKYAGQIDSIVRDLVFNDKYDGCYDRPEYYVFEHYSKGTSFNCLTIRHIDTQRELYNPDDPDTRITTSIRKYLRDNPSVKFPPIMLRSMHSYYSRLVGGNWYEVSYSADPKNFNSPQITKFSEETSEFHKYNISNYPKHKKTMDLWVSISANRHQEFERMSRSKKRHLLNLNKYNPINYDNKNQNKVIKKDIAEQIKKLNDLYKSGALTKEEFEKAKKKILN